MLDNVTDKEENTGRGKMRIQNLENILKCVFDKRSIKKLFRKFHTVNGDIRFCHN